MKTSSQLDENVIRLVAIQTIIIVLTSVTFRADWLLYLLSIDFMLRGVFKIPSLLSVLAKGILYIKPLAVKPVFAPPKWFAARIGLFFSLIAAIGFTFHFNYFALTVCIILAFCAFLEAAFRVCLGCYLHHWIARIIF